MIKRALTLTLLLSGVLNAAPQRESLAVQEMRASLDRLGYQLRSHQVEIDLFQERLASLEKSLTTQGSQAGREERAVEGRLAKLEKAHATLVNDLKSLKGHLNETSSAVTACQNKLTKIDKQLSSDVQGLKRSLESMLVLLQKGESSGSYIVKPGDSLGQIALDHKTDIKTLKRLNHLTSDTIVVGQKLVLPQ